MMYIYTYDTNKSPYAAAIVVIVFFKAYFFVYIS